MVFVIADLHLPLGINKSMDIFGKRWENYVERLEENWQNVVGGNDTVVIPGDFSWATYLQQATADFDFLEKLNGKKIILKGNHDFWWTTMTKLEEYVRSNGYKTISFLQNNSFEADGISICGTRGWMCPGSAGFSEEDRKYFIREVGRLEMSLKTAKTDEIYVFTHYPPMTSMGEENEFTQMLSKYNVKKCFYGHLHGNSQHNSAPQERNGISYSLIASDFLQFRPKRIV